MSGSVDKKKEMAFMKMYYNCVKFTKKVTFTEEYTRTMYENNVRNSRTVY